MHFFPSLGYGKYNVNYAAPNSFSAWKGYRCPKEKNVIAGHIVNVTQGTLLKIPECLASSPLPFPR